jgi:hypothetical protein
MPGYLTGFAGFSHVTYALSLNLFNQTDIAINCLSLTLKGIFIQNA